MPSTAENWRNGWGVQQRTASGRPHPERVEERLAVGESGGGDCAGSARTMWQFDAGDGRAGTEAHPAGEASAAGRAVGTDCDKTGASRGAEAPASGTKGPGDRGSSDHSTPAGDNAASDPGVTQQNIRERTRGAPGPTPRRGGVRVQLPAGMAMPGGVPRPATLMSQPKRPVDFSTDAYVEWRIAHPEADPTVPQEFDWMRAMREGPARPLARRLQWLVGLMATEGIQAIVDSTVRAAKAGDPKAAAELGLYRAGHPRDRGVGSP